MLSQFKRASGRGEGVLIVVPPAETEKVVRDAAESGIRWVWMQQGAGSDEGVRFCRENGINVVHGECPPIISLDYYPH